MVSKPYVCENDETIKDTKAGEDKVDECVWVLRERKSVLGYQKPLVSFTLPRTGVSLLLLSEQSQVKQAGMSCAQPQDEAVSLEQKASFFLKIYIRPVVAEIFPLSLGFKFE
jgi:hypothetical protein